MTSLRTPRTVASGPSGLGLASRLLLSQGIVLAASILSAGFVAAMVGPPLFHQHMMEAGHREDAPELGHIEEAYRTASTLALGGGLIVSLLCAFAATWFVTRRLQRPLAALTASAQRVSRGQYDARVEATGAGPEFDSLADAFNSMAAQLETTEDTRRRLLTDLAHEMRTPIATITAYVEGVDDGVTTWTRATRDVLCEQVERLTRLADDIDDVSRAEEGRIALSPAAHDVGQLLAATVSAAREGYAERGVALVVRAEDAAVWVDEQRFAQVMANLLGNALRHTPTGGQVAISAHPDRDIVTITVTDTGEGIGADQLSRVFERFYRGDSARDRIDRGSGIGLTISKALVEASGGHLTAASDGAGRGATFAMTLPTASSNLH
jgi:two-component system, OmpR family, sensor histidine kinase BaeS